MKKLLLASCFAISSIVVVAQAKTTEALQKQFDSSLSLYFYKNTLRMLNQTENKDFDEMIKDIEKMKFLMVDKTSKNFGNDEYKKLKKDYQAERYEAIMTSRHEGRNFDIYVKDTNDIPGTVVLVNDSTNLFVLDMIGKIDVTKVGTLFSTIDGSADIGKKISNFMDHGSKKSKQGRDTDH